MSCHMSRHMSHMPPKRTKWVIPRRFSSGPLIGSLLWSRRRTFDLPPLLVVQATSTAIPQIRALVKGTSGASSTAAFAFRAKSEGKALMELDWKNVKGDAWDDVPNSGFGRRRSFMFRRTSLCTIPWCDKATREYIMLQYKRVYKYCTMQIYACALQTGL